MAQTTLYFYQTNLEQPLTVGLVKQISQQLTEEGQPAPQLYSLEPTAQLPVINDEIKPGRLKGFFPLMPQLPAHLEYLPLQTASIHGGTYWVNLVAGDALSEQAAQAFFWFTQQPNDQETEELIGLEEKTQSVLAWQDLERFNLERHFSQALEHLKVTHYLHNGKRITWQLIQNNKE